MVTTLKRSSHGLESPSKQRSIWRWLASEQGMAILENPFNIPTMTLPR
jgi:hypothetical protein